MNTKLITTALIFVLGSMIGTGCNPYGSMCSKYESCIAENEEGFKDFDADDDFVGTCTASLETRDAVLRANEEPECDVLADAARDLAGCIAGLKCDDIIESDRGGECDDQVDAYEDALEDAGDDCQGGA